MTCSNRKLINDTLSTVLSFVNHIDEEVAIKNHPALEFVSAGDAQEPPQQILVSPDKIMQLCQLVRGKFQFRTS